MVSIRTSVEGWGVELRAVFFFLLVLCQLKGYGVSLHCGAQHAALFLQLSNSVNCHLEVVGVVLFVCRHVFPIHPCIAANALVFARYHSVLTLKLNVLIEVLALHGFRATSVGAWKNFFVTGFIMDLCYSSMRALLPTVLTLIISIGTILSKVFLQILSHEQLDFVISILTLLWALYQSEPACGEVIC